MTSSHFKFKKDDGKEGAAIGTWIASTDSGRNQQSFGFNEANFFFLCFFLFQKQEPSQQQQYIRIQSKMRRFKPDKKKEKQTKEKQDKIPRPNTCT